MRLNMLTMNLALIVVSLACSQAVVHGVQPFNLQYASNNDLKHGYRYNGPAHKYLPAASTPTTEAVITTGHWQPNPLPQQATQQQVHYEHSLSNNAVNSYEQQGYSGPYNMQHYQQHTAQASRQQLGHYNNDPHHHDNNDNTFPFGQTSDFKATAAPAAFSQFGAVVDLSAGTHQDRHVESDQRGAQLIGQALPELYQRQQFASEPPRQQSTRFEEQLGGSQSYVQMQSHSYELPTAVYNNPQEWQDMQRYTPVQMMPNVNYAHYSQQQQQQQQQKFSTPTPSSSYYANNPTMMQFMTPSREFQAPYY
ncbi:CG11381 [Drosophila busckii]|uniref:CG11381 n=1 Tax=Drosophila busckii TaxID=30019 RepID=A0A0M3QZP3_DROBS|nr:ell-associated factor Eaf [Drosophila busckii]XP_017851348.1 ell-associated factor Eaf [Drosophila busckii]ALC49729.1 CG11381 [Drosophila busckii]